MTSVCVCVQANPVAISYSHSASAGSHLDYFDIGTDNPQPKQEAPSHSPLQGQG